MASSSRVTAHSLFIGCGLAPSQKHSLHSILEHHWKQLSGNGLRTSSSMWLRDQPVTLYSSVGYVVDGVEDSDVARVSGFGVTEQRLVNAGIRAGLSEQFEQPSAFLAAGADDLLSSSFGSGVVVGKSAALRWNGGPQRIANAISGLQRSLGDLAIRLGEFPRGQDGFKHYSEVIATLSQSRHTVSQVVIDHADNSFYHYNHHDLNPSSDFSALEQKLLKLGQAAVIKAFWDQKQNLDLPTVYRRGRSKQHGGPSDRVKRFENRQELWSKIQRVVAKMTKQSAADHITVTHVLNQLKNLRDRLNHNYVPHGGNASRAVNFQQLMPDSELRTALESLSGQTVHPAANAASRVPNPPAPAPATPAAPSAPATAAAPSAHAPTRPSRGFWANLGRAVGRLFGAIWRAIVALARKIRLA
jgi:hypothetical protein